MPPVPTMPPVPAIPARPTGEATARAVAFVAARRQDAEQLGRDLAEQVQDPDAVVWDLQAAFARLADPDYLAGQQFVAPGIGALIGVRWPLHAAVARGFRQATRQDPSSTLLFVAERLLREEELELRWFAFGILERTLVGEPERTWQLLRGAAREVGDWITVDALAHPYGRGILLEPHRWAELEQLAFSSSRWERRLVGSTLATIPHVDRRSGRTPQIVDRALPLLAQLIGDDQPDVQKSLGWAYRTMAQLDPQRTLAAIAIEAERAANTHDGHRTWVIRDTLPKLPPAQADRLRARLAGIRKRPGEPSSSVAAAAAARFRANERSLGDADL